MSLYSFLGTDQELCQSLASELKQARKDSIKVAARKASQAKQKQGGGSGNNSPGSGSPGASRTATAAVRTTGAGNGSPNGGSVFLGRARAPEGYDEGTAAQAAILATLEWNETEESVDASAYITGSGLKSARDATDIPIQTEQSV